MPILRIKYTSPNVQIYDSSVNLRYLIKCHSDAVFVTD